MTIGRGDAAYDTAAEVYGLVGAAGVETEIWRATVPAQEAWMWGAGSPLLPDNQGWMYFFIADLTTSFAVGTLRIASNNLANIDPHYTKTLDDTRLHTATPTTVITATPTRRDEMTPLPVDKNSCRGFSSKLQLLYTMITIGTADAAAFSIPYTRFLL